MGPRAPMNTVTLQKQCLVAKFGGSSLATPEKVSRVAKKIARLAEGDRPVVCVVSAMGNTTDELLGVARAVADDPPRRELDMLLSAGERISIAVLAMALEGLGRPAISLTGPQCGIITDNVHADATILDVRPERVHRELAAGNVVIVAGYQGLSISGEVTTLGRGGSDTTAVALAAALGAERCGIFSDVPGVFTADPRVVKGARHLSHVDTALMREYSVLGARVLHPASIDHALRGGVEVQAASTFDDSLSTVIAGGATPRFSPPHTDRPVALGVTSRKRRLRAVAEDGARLAELLERVPAEARPEGAAGPRREVLLDLDDVPDPDALSAGLAEDFGGRGVTLEDGLSSVSVVTTDPVAAPARDALRRAVEGIGVRPRAVEQTAHGLTCALDAADRERAMKALHHVFVERAEALEPALAGGAR